MKMENFSQEKILETHETASANVEKSGYLESFKKKARLMMTLSAAVGAFLAAEGVTENVYADGQKGKDAKTHEVGKSVEAKSQVVIFATYLEKITTEAKAAYESVQTEEQAEAFCKKYIDPVIEKYRPIQPQVLESPMEEITKLEAAATDLADLSHKLHNNPRFGDALCEKDQPRRKALYDGVKGDITCSRLFREIREKHEENLLNMLENLSDSLKKIGPPGAK